MYKESAKSVVEHVHKQVAIENGTNTKFDAAGKDAAIRNATCFHESTKTVNEVQNESVKYIIELVHKRVVTGDGTNSRQCR